MDLVRVCVSPIMWILGKISVMRAMYLNGQGELMNCNEQHNIKKQNLIKRAYNKALHQ